MRSIQVDVMTDEVNSTTHYSPFEGHIKINEHRYGGYYDEMYENPGNYNYSPPLSTQESGVYEKYIIKDSNNNNYTGNGMFAGNSFPSNLTWDKINAGYNMEFKEVNGVVHIKAYGADNILSLIHI